MDGKTVCIIAFVSGCLASLPRPRGVAISMSSNYEPDKPFRCVDGSKEVPFEYVNDDYCDCIDGSDEPGTSACPSGKFHCSNVGYKAMYILSSRVNDGICDCCDGSDEWSGNIECVNNCNVLGRKMQEEAARIRTQQDIGYQKKLQFMDEGKRSRLEKKAQLEQLERTKTELESVKNEMEAQKNEAEIPEKEAKEEHEKAWQEILEVKKMEKDKQRAQIAFEELDTNGDRKLDISEIKACAQFDVDSNGEVSDDEAKEHLEGVEQADLDHFILKVWPNIKQLYKPPSTEEPPKGENLGDDTSGPPIGTDHHAEEDDNEDDDNDEIDDDKDEDKPADNSTVSEEEKMPDYDDQTKALIEVADVARKNFNDAESKLKDTENMIRSLESYLNIDYGPDEEFSVLKGNCYEYTDREYTYKMCAFDRATQRPKSGGSETTLGNWGQWDGGPEDIYAAQKYENGQSCWNGPNRSVKVFFKCGLEHRITSVSEPSRCEYAYDFETPTRCSPPPQGSATVDHDEL